MEQVHERSNIKNLFAPSVMAIPATLQASVQQAERSTNSTELESIAAFESHQTLAVETISLPTKQPRRYFDPTKMEQLVESVRKHGVLENLIVRPLLNTPHQYELVIGERRYRAAIVAGLTEVPAVIHCLNDDQALSLALIENLQREDLSPIEETEGVLELLSLRLQLPMKESIALLYRLQHEKKGQTAHNVIGSHQVEQVEAVFAELGKFTWDSFVSNRLPLLRLPEEILLLVRAGKLAYTKAQAIARVKDKGFQKSLLDETLAQDLSLGQIRQRIHKDLRVTPPEVTVPKDLLGQTYQRIQASKAWSDPQKRARVKELLRELSALLES
jgi:ParB family chromosome partitioning protein